MTIIDMYSLRSQLRAGRWWFWDESEAVSTQRLSQLLSVLANTSHVMGKHATDRNLARADIGEGVEGNTCRRSR